ncbi:MAG: hypothetical protein JWR59_171, partial [Brevundimonas sp.]|nr:hypothetical protein [Brevundimonas sp.]
DASRAPTGRTAAAAMDRDVMPMPTSAHASSGSAAASPQIMKGSVVCRMPILDITTTGEDKARHCLITLSPEVIRTAPQARRPFQGWRYLEPKDAPADMSSMDAGEMPEDLALKLREMGAW